LTPTSNELTPERRIIHYNYVVVVSVVQAPSRAGRLFH